MQAHPVRTRTTTQLASRIDDVATRALWRLAPSGGDRNGTDARVGRRGKPTTKKESRCERETYIQAHVRHRTQWSKGLSRSSKRRERAIRSLFYRKHQRLCPAAALAKRLTTGHSPGYGLPTSFNRRRKSSLGDAPSPSPSPPPPRPHSIIRTPPGDTSCSIF